MKYIARDNEIVQMVIETNLTYEEIANKFGISKQRVQQIIKGKARRENYGGGLRVISIDVDSLRQKEKARLLKKIEQVDSEYPIIQDWYVNRLTVGQIMQKWGIKANEFTNINRRWRNYHNYYKRIDE